MVKRFTPEGPPAVVDLSLAVAAGEFVTLLGPSGSGKSTTLLMVAGFEAPTSGEILLDGTVMTGVPAYRRNLGMVFQNYALFPHLTVFENVAFSLRVRRRGWVELERAVAQALALVKLEGFATRYPRQLSGGQQQRVALARALVFRPPVLLMDEPLGALDKKLRQHMQLELKALQRQLGVTVVYVTHDQEEALAMSDRIVVMNNGRTEQAGPPAELYDSPTTPFVADFVGETNLLRGRVTKRDSTVATVQLDAGPVIIARAGNEPVGSEVRVSLRPERIRLHSAEEPESLGPATVQQVVYLGEATKYQLRLGTAPELLVKTPSDRAQPCFRSGDRVWLSWHPEDAIVVPEQQAKA